MKDVGAFLAAAGTRWSRRRILQALVAGGVAHGLGGCVRPVSPICPNDPIWTPPDAASTIDVHAHFFNARDLPVARFIELTTQDTAGGFGEVISAIGKLLQDVSWGIAPGARCENRRLDRIASAIKSCDARNLDRSIVDTRQEQYTVARNQLQRAAAAFQAREGVNPRELRNADFETLAPERRALKSIDLLPQTYEQFRDVIAGSSPEALRVNMQSGLYFVVEMFQYRYVSFLTYLETYSKRPERRVDLACSALVDYDWWLDRGEPTKTRLPDQIKLMQRLSIVTGGRMHAWAPFCPFREVMAREGARTFSSLDVVKDAVLNRGAIGVKLYPPMGFRPYGNALQLRDFWDVGWLHPRARRADFGARLDEVLGDLYAWCEDADVPILAHTASSNGPSQAFRDSALAPGWELALHKFKDLRVNFAHFGGGSDEAKRADALAFIALLGDADAAGNHAYADASYFEEALDKPEDLGRVLQDLFSVAADPRQLLALRFLYGSDWKMLSAQVGAGEYLSRFERLVNELAAQSGQQQESLRRQFFHRNAVEFLGLERGSQQRGRLDQFYTDSGMTSAPVWARSVDA